MPAPDSTAEPRNPVRSDGGTFAFPDGLVLGLFFLSGACTLIYELVWVRMLVLVFGASVLAVSTVLTAFMAGLALGSAWFGRVVDRKGNGLRIYAWLELGIGLFALVFPLVLARLDDIYTLVYRHLGGNDYVFAVIRFLLVFLVLLVPTTLMGATLPVLTRFLARRLAGVGRSVGALYAVNTFGAVSGCFIAAFVLIDLAGIWVTIYVTAAVNLLIAATSFLLSARERTPSPGLPVREPPGPEPPRPGRPPFVARLVFWGFALSGFTALGYEVLWTRLLAVSMHLTATETLSLILIAFLLGLAAGGAVGAKFVDRWKRLFSVFGGIEILMGLFGLGSIAILGTVPHLLNALDVFPSWWGYLLKLLFVTLAVVIVPTFLMGLLFPVAGKLYVSGLGSLGRRIGNIYAVNTTGAIFGAFAAGFVLIPLLGTQKSIQLLAWLNVALGSAVLILAADFPWGKRLRILAALVLPALLVAGFLPSTITADLMGKSESGSELLYYDEDTGGTVTVYERKNGKRLLRVNGAGEVPTDHASIQVFRLLGNLPLVLHPAPESALVVAFGGGVTLGAVDLHPLERIDCVELVPGVLGAAPYFAEYNNRVFERVGDGKLEVIADDGRNHLLRTERSYDIIIADATHPATADSWVLYTREFYRLCKQRLREGGYVAQWLPLHGLAADDYRAIVRTFRSVFPHASLWVTSDYSVMLGTPERLRIDFARLEERLARDDVKENLAAVDLEDPVAFLATFALDEDAVANYVTEGPIKTDNRPDMDFVGSLIGGGRAYLPTIMGLVPHFHRRIDSSLANANRELGARMERRLLARRHTFRGDVALRLGDLQRARDELQRAGQVDPEERERRRVLRRLEITVERSR